MCKKNFMFISVLLFSIGVFTFLIKNDARKNTIQIGVLIPMEHAAIREIIAGFKDAVIVKFPNAAFNIQSASGDLKLQRSIIELFMGQKMDLIVPIGTSATQMTLSIVKEQPIVSLAAQYTEKQRLERNPKNMTGIGDEIGALKKLDFIKDIMPQLRYLTLIAHSGNEKNFDEIAELKSYSQKFGLELQIIMIQNLPDLEMAARAIHSRSQGLLILKDNLLASGIRMLVNIAKRQDIPLFASDEGSVQEGATLGLGVKERSVGSEGGKLAIKILEGQAIQELPIQQVNHLSVFYRHSACEAQNITLQQLHTFANKNLATLIQVDDQK